MKNSVHIALANTILVNLTIDGHLLKTNEGMSKNVSRILSSFGIKEEADDKIQKKRSILSEASEILALLCGMFSLDIIFLSGEAAKTRTFVSRVRETLAAILAPNVPPPIKVVESEGSNLSKKMAVQIRSVILNTP